MILGHVCLQQIASCSFSSRNFYPAINYSFWPPRSKMLGVVLVFYLSLHFLVVDSTSSYSNGTKPEQVHLAATGECFKAICGKQQQDPFATPALPLA